ncbi:hypothetical protein KEF85_00185 [Methylomonas paludis]|uniref:Wadjet protein JetD C-terminal domain-containing protein n=1 Tax=Methylomonas paludis TaxID=1173101 RepID=A0A975MNC9_9GAMM|nr:Wadjet anti-phage system protein JetD domain-containing protein [Methylomonas paludis]QWF70962.1 hypothetical protein KEF85_00185 [Methylomonas paludis]
MSWTTPADLRRQILVLWQKGIILAEVVNGTDLFPKRLSLKTPNAAEMLARFDEVRAWIQAVNKQAHIRVVMRETQHRQLGSNLMPAEVWLDSAEAAAALIDMQKPLRRFRQLLMQTEARLPAVRSWLGKRPLVALELAEVWPQLLEVTAWVQEHPQPGIYLRQIDVPGVHSKFVEAHRSILQELLDLVLPAEHITASVSRFNRRYGFLDKPERIRFRVLDDNIGLFSGLHQPDVSLDVTNFAALRGNIRLVFITENEINFLAFPPQPQAIVIFGGGYGFAALSTAAWLQQCQISYWGDIDTHGFAILSQLRAYFPQVKSLLMDRSTLLNFSAMWGHEAKPINYDLPHLTSDEQSLYDDLRDNRIQPNLRLEQERIGFEWVLEKIGEISP